jgi:myo-inositol-1(or 4)-monophosphatase
MDVMATESLSALLLTARRALLEGGAIVKKGFARRRRVEYKGPISPVTDVDRAAERAIMKVIRARFPAHTFLAEESAHARRGDLGKAREGRFRWVIDPLDGTTNFVHHLPHSCVSVAVETGGRVLAGGVYDPYRNELFSAARGRGATVNGARLRVSDVSTLRRSLLMTGFPYDSHTRARAYMGLVEKVLAKTMGVRRFGAAALDLAWVAAGRIDGFWEMKLSPWDVAAGWLLVAEAGGKVSRFDGAPYQLDDPRQTLATNGRIHPALIRLFRDKSK